MNDSISVNIKHDHSDV